MIVSIGIDLVRIDRLQSIARRWENRCLARVYTQSERDACFARAIPFPALAGRFALKEAMFNMLGTGWSAGQASAGWMVRSPLTQQENP